MQYVQSVVTYISFVSNSSWTRIHHSPAAHSSLNTARKVHIFIIWREISVVDMAVDNLGIYLVIHDFRFWPKKYFSLTNGGVDMSLLKGFGYLWYILVAASQGFKD